MQMTLEDATGSVARVLEGMFVGLEGLTRPTLALGKAAAGAAAMRHAKTALHAMIEGKLQNVYDDHVLVCDARDDRNNAVAKAAVDEWDSALDDKVEALLEEHEKLVSAGWLGEHCTDSRLHEEGGVERMAKSFAEDAWRVLTFVPQEGDTEAHYMTPSEVLQAIGVYDSVIKEALEAAPQPTPQQEEEIKVATLADTKKRLALAMEKRGHYDRKEMCQELDDASDEDNIIANAAIERLGALRGDVLVLRKYKEDNGIFVVDGWAEFADAVEAMTGQSSGDQVREFDGAEGEVVDADDVDLEAMFGGSDPYIENPDRYAVSPPVVAPPPPAAGAVPPPSGPPAVTPPPAAPAAPAVPEKPKRQRQGGEAPEGAVPAEALQKLKEHSGLNDEQLGALVGVSRATFGNYAKGKAFLVPQPSHLTNLLALIDQKREALGEARSLIEGI